MCAPATWRMADLDARMDDGRLVKEEDSLNLFSSTIYKSLSLEQNIIEHYCSFGHLCHHLPSAQSLIILLLLLRCFACRRCCRITTGKDPMVRGFDRKAGSSSASAHKKYVIFLHHTSMYPPQPYPSDLQCRWY